jgi:hypothetical protein
MSKASIAVAAGILTSLVFARSALADQCQAITETQAWLALKIIKGSDRTYADYCEKCGDKQPVVRRAKTWVVKKDGEHHTLTLNGKPVDLAYTYFPMIHGEFWNLAKAVGCPYEGSPDTLKIGAHKKP